MMSISTTAEVFGYYADGVPVAEVVLYANATASEEIGYRYIPPSTGKSIPISPQVSNGLRFVYVVRYYDCNTTNGEWRPELTPSSTLRILAVDLHDDSIPRLQLPFQLDLPLDPILQHCMPVSGGRFAGTETIVVAGPMLRPDGLSILFSLTCMHGDTIGKNNTAFLFAASIDGAKGDFPKVLWTSSLSLPSPVTLVSTSLFTEGIPPLPFPILRSLIQDASDTSIVWAIPQKSPFFTAIDQSSGKIVAQLDLVSMIQNAPVKLCPLSASVNSVTDRIGHAQVVVEFNGQPVASSDVPSSTADKDTAAPLGSTILVAPVLSFITNVQHWIVGLSLNARSTSEVLWCVLTPPGNSTSGKAAGSSPVSGQIAPVVNKDGNVTIVFATELGLFGIV